MKNYLIIIIGALFFITSLTACKSGRAITKAIAPRDTTAVVKANNVNDSLIQVKTAIENLMQHKIDYKTFKAKIKLDIEDSKKKYPDLIANIKMIKDSAIWISISAQVVIPIELFRVFIKKDSVILLDVREKTVQYRSIDYLQDITNVPFDFATIQDLIIGNPIFFNDKNVSVKKFEKYSLISTVDKGFKSLITLTSPVNLLEHCKLDDLDITQNRTADFTYDDYENGAGFPFSTKREIIVTEKNKLEIKMNYKQYEFNKELSINFSVPKSYKKK